MRLGKALPSLLLAAAICCAALSMPQASHAETSYVLDPGDPSVAATCAGLGGSWDGSSTCTLGSSLNVASGDSVALEPGAVLAIPKGVTLTDYGSVDVAGTIIVDAGTVTVAGGSVLEANGTITIGAGGLLANSGTVAATVAAEGKLTNEGSMVNYPGGSIGIDSPGRASFSPSPSPSSYNSGAYFTNSGVLDNRGNFTSYGSLANGAGALISNSGNFSLASAAPNTGGSSAPATLNAGTFDNLARGTFIDGGATINNTGTFANAGVVEERQNAYSVINNTGTFENNGTLANGGFVDNDGGTITNSGTISNLVGCSTASCGSISNEGVVVNYPGGTIDNRGNIGNTNLDPLRHRLGAFTNNGTLNNYDVFVNDLGGTLASWGTINNSGTLSNLASFDNLGSVVNSGNIQNSGHADNDVGASITNSRTITNSGSIQNSGTLSNACGGVVYGSGTITGSPVTTAGPCDGAATISPAPEFPSEAALPVMLFALIAVSLVIARRSGAPGHR